MKHTFLVEPAAWTAAGTFFNAGGVCSDAFGKVTIVHEGDNWVGDRVIRIGTEPPVDLHMRYTIKPLPPGQMTTTWTAESPTLGQLYGTFLFTPDTIVSVFSSADGRFSGSEHLSLDEDGRYRAMGNLLEGKESFASWRVELKRIR